MHYPFLSSTRANYERRRRKGNGKGNGGGEGGYGFLLSVVFREDRCAMAFYDALEVAKGPSLGADFTLAIPYAQVCCTPFLSSSLSPSLPCGGYNFNFVSLI